MRLIIIFAIIFVILFSVPIMTQTRIRVTTDRDYITNVSVETPNVPLIVWLFPSSLVGKGAYTIKVEVFNNSALVYNSTLLDVPSGDFTFIWMRNGIPEAGRYHIVVRLFRESAEVDVYSLDVNF